MGEVTMSEKEAKRVSALERYLGKQIPRQMAADELGLSERQVSRLVSRYREQGVKGLVHLGRGQPSPQKIAERSLERVIQIIRKDYGDFSPAFAYEKLVERGEISFSCERLRQEMVRQDLHRPRRTHAMNIHQSRERRARYGELVQGDGSPHAWFEGRGAACTLLVFIDDATSKYLLLLFVKSESTAAYFKAIRAYLKQHGKTCQLLCRQAHGVSGKQPSWP
ncbi:hypothetical protein AUK40_05000 [Candidatus Wirthbacteria bacterium CG2_30_54_11]|uniref:Insertion element IS150 protein InsJ-like helix-turn-helix domain-containing protein n=1 Tax=Candidatus Wirthbacteria bacterium CG2_30_54_11 TaxID=1817892 RepID=A0A1J5IH64_9BACT|nr:MAG: hypothetical protein AUK40_05000 [Candidatus Wirthbacteria bacterium CG2_30_54_11]